MKKKVLIIQQTISDYNIPLFEELLKNYEITLLHSDKKIEKEVFNFATIYVPWIQVFNKAIHIKNIVNIARKFDIVICMFSMYYLYFDLLSRVKNKKYKIIYWGIGVSASYESRFDENQKYISRYLDWIKRADSVVFYSDYPKEKYIKYGVDSSKLFVANNTVKIEKINLTTDKDSFLFVGSLYKQKRVDLLLEEYAKAFQRFHDIPKMYIIGDGVERHHLEELSKSNELNDKVVFCGEIKDETILKKYFSKAILCFSPDQAGLSVLKAMGYGVPFVTSKNAITGGEIFNIEQDKTGVLLESFDLISEIMIDATVCKEKYIKMGINAYEFYWNNRTIQDMAQGFIDAISYSLSL